MTFVMCRLAKAISFSFFFFFFQVLQKTSSSHLLTTLTNPFFLYVWGPLPHTLRKPSPRLFPLCLGASSSHPPQAQPTPFSSMFGGLFLTPSASPTHAFSRYVWGPLPHTLCKPNPRLFPLCLGASSSHPPQAQPTPFSSMFGGLFLTPSASPTHAFFPLCLGASSSHPPQAQPTPFPSMFGGLFLTPSASPTHAFSIYVWILFLKPSASPTHAFFLYVWGPLPHTLRKPNPRLFPLCLGASSSHPPQAQPTPFSSMFGGLFLTPSASPTHAFFLYVWGPLPHTLRKPNPRLFPLCLGASSSHPPQAQPTPFPAMFGSSSSHPPQAQPTPFPSMFGGLFLTPSASPTHAFFLYVWGPLPHTLRKPNPRLFPSMFGGLFLTPSASPTHAFSRYVWILFLTPSASPTHAFFLYVWGPLPHTHRKPNPRLFPLCLGASSSHPPQAQPTPFSSMFGGLFLTPSASPTHAFFLYVWGPLPHTLRKPNPRLFPLCLGASSSHPPQAQPTPFPAMFGSSSSHPPQAQPTPFSSMFGAFSSHLLATSTHAVFRYVWGLFLTPPPHKPNSSLFLLCLGVSMP